MDTLFRPQDQSADRPHPRYYRVLIGVCGAVYLAWWFGVQALMPGSVNPFGGRLAVVGYCWGLLAASFASKTVARRLPSAALSCMIVVTAHYFYLLHLNAGDPNWAIGTYITVIAASTCPQRAFGYLVYSGAVLALSVLVAMADHATLSPVFLPGIATVLTFGYLGLQARLELVARSRESAVWFEQLFDGVFEGVVVHDRGLIIAVNEPYAAIFGYTIDEMIGSRVIDHVAPERRIEALARIEDKVQGVFETVGLRKDGSTVPIEVRAKNHSLNGRDLRLSAITDITGRKDAERDRIRYEASQHAIRMRDEFLSIASHELNTPLTNIKLQAQLALRLLEQGDDRQLEPARMRKFIAQTDKQADRLTRLIQEMLDVSRITAGKLKLERESFDLSALVRESCAAFESSAAQAGSRISIHAPDGAVTLLADRFRVEQVVSNLLSNAIKYGGGKPIDVTVEHAGGEARVVFVDRGVGIPAEHQERIFQRFERAIAPENISGLGLGLFIAERIMSEHGGRIDVTSRPGAGSRFTIVLPASFYST